MPLVARTIRDNELGVVEQDGVFLERLPPWQARELTDDEAARVSDLLMLLLRRSHFSDAQIAQVFFPNFDPDVKRVAVYNRLRRMEGAFREAGFAEIGVIP
jgi:hypothetical protein